MDLAVDIWHIPVILGAGLLSIVPVLPGFDLNALAYFVGVAAGWAIWVRALQIAHAEVVARYGDRLPGVMETRDWALSLVIAYVYVGLNAVTVLQVSEPTPTLVAIAVAYGAGIAAVIASVKIAYVYFNSGQRPSSF